MTRRHEGSCHCGRVRFAVTSDERRVWDCNCSVCRKKAFLHLIVPAEEFSLLSGADDLATYRFGTGIAKHTFCRHCGVHGFYIPRSHPNGVSINLRCLGGDLSAFQIEPFDGENWENNVETIR